MYWNKRTSSNKCTVCVFSLCLSQGSHGNLTNQFHDFSISFFPFSQLSITFHKIAVAYELAMAFHDDFIFQDFQGFFMTVWTLLLTFVSQPFPTGLARNIYSETCLQGHLRTTCRDNLGIKGNYFSHSRPIQYTEMDLRNKTTSEFRTVFTVSWVSLIPRFHCS